MISDFDRSLGSRYFLNIANERTCFASCASAFKSSGFVSTLDPFIALESTWRLHVCAAY